jgi:hypothetical protein
MTAFLTRRRFIRSKQQFMQQFAQFSLHIAGLKMKRRFQFMLSIIHFMQNCLYNARTAQQLCVIIKP